VPFRDHAAAGWFKGYRAEEFGVEAAAATTFRTRRAPLRDNLKRPTLLPSIPEALIRRERRRCGSARRRRFAESISFCDPRRQFASAAVSLESTWPQRHNNSSSRLSSRRVEAAARITTQGIAATNPTITAVVAALACKSY
jgi:hypothetical protein